MNEARPDAEYSEPVPGRGIDPKTGRMVDGFYRTNIRKCEVEFTPGPLPGTHERMEIDE
jgi:hypothetical protein